MVHARRLRDDGGDDVERPGRGRQLNDQLRGNRRDRGIAADDLDDRRLRTAQGTSASLRGDGVPPATEDADSVKPPAQSRYCPREPYRAAVRRAVEAVACAVWEKAPGAVTRTVTQTSSPNEPATPIVGNWQLTVLVALVQVPAS